MSKPESPATWVCLLLCLLLSGCAVNEKDIFMGADICKDHKGILFLWATSDSVWCNDGLKANYGRIK